MREMIRTIGVPDQRAVDASDAARDRGLCTRWDLKTKVIADIDGSFEVQIDLLHRGEAVDICVLPTIRGFGSRTDAVDYMLAWVDAWTQVNR